jgi:serine/threonine-protein kinase
MNHGDLTGSQLGAYQIETVLGAGGMGVVYRATDSKLGRQVAIKLLPEGFAEDPDRLARFEREARTLAALNHPNIGAIHGLEQSKDLRYLVLEFVHGETLEQRLSARSLDAEEALRACLQVAEALEYAHEKGVVHRDLKPANVIITPDGKVKVLDFGLAKTQADSDVLSAAPTMMATRAGMVLGTPSYMSPEQARGKEVDKRTDIWAFGCLLYEVLARRLAFGGATVPDCLAAILGQEPDWEALPQSTPTNVRNLLRRCLQRDVQSRLRDIGDARIELAETLAVLSGVHAPAPVHASKRRKVVPALLAVTVALAIVTTIVAVTRRTPPPQTERLSIDLPAGEFIPPTQSSQLALSPDGMLIAYGSMKVMQPVTTMTPTAGQGSDMMGQGAMPSGMAPTDKAPSSATGQPMDMGPNSGMAARTMMMPQIHIRSITEPQGKPIEGAIGDGPFFSPDGKWLGFWDAATRSLRKVGLAGGGSVKIADLETGVAGAAWGPDDAIVYAWFDLFRVPAAGGTPALLLKVDEKNGERFYRQPSFLPGGKAILFTISTAETNSYDDARIAVLSLDTGEKKVLVEGGSTPVYSPSGHLVYARGGKLLAVPFDAPGLRVTGPPFQVVDGVFMSSNTGMAAFAISPGGSLVYATGPQEGGQRVPTWVDRSGRATPLPVPPRSYLHPRLSPDGQKLAIEIEGSTHDFYGYDFPREVMTKLSFDGASHWPLWTPNGDRITFRSWKTGTMTMWWMPADRSGQPELLTDVGRMQSPESWSPDGKTLVFTQMDNPETETDIYALTLGGPAPRPLLRTKFAEGSPKFSPDGRWLAYSSDESGRAEVYVMAYPGPGPKIQISTDGGTDPIWRRNGDELYYRNGDAMVMVRLATSPRVSVSKPTVLWKGRYLAGVGSSCGMEGPTSANYDVTANGDRFLMILDKSQDIVSKQVRIVSNWSAVLKATASAPSTN